MHNKKRHNYGRRTQAKVQRKKPLVQTDMTEKVLYFAAGVLTGLGGFMLATYLGGFYYFS